MLSEISAINLIWFNTTEYRAGCYAVRFRLPCPALAMLLERIRLH